MDKNQVREFIIRPALKAINLWSVNAEELLMGTAAQESKLFTYVRQVGIIDPNVGGFGPFQMEPSTYDDLWNRMVAAKGITDKILHACDLVCCNCGAVKPDVTRLMTNLDLAVIMCRLKYLDNSEALPDASDVPAMAAYWKKYYNTPLGAGTEQQFIDNYRLYVKG